MVKSPGQWGFSAGCWQVWDAFKGTPASLPHVLPLLTGCSLAHAPGSPDAQSCLWCWERSSWPSLCLILPIKLAPLPFYRPLRASSPLFVTLHQDLRSLQQYPWEWISPILFQIVSLLVQSYGALFLYDQPFPIDRAPGSLTQHGMRESTSPRVTPLFTVGTWEGRPLFFLACPSRCGTLSLQASRGRGRRSPSSPICFDWVGNDRQVISVPLSVT